MGIGLINPLEDDEREVQVPIKVRKGDLGSEYNYRNSNKMKQRVINNRHAVDRQLRSPYLSFRKKIRRNMF